MLGNTGGRSVVLLGGYWLCVKYFQRRKTFLQSQRILTLQIWKNLFYKYNKFLISSTALVTFSFATKLEILAKDTVSDKTVIDEADKLYNDGDIRNLYIYLKSYESTSNANILWRLARAARDLAIKSENVAADEKKKLIYEAFESSRRALELDEQNFAAHKWYAITIGDVGDYEGVRVKISNAYVIRDHLERAAELNPDDATTLHCLGMWCYVFADMPGWQHTIAGWIFATPPSSSFSEAAHFFSLAEKVDPNFYSVNLLMLGKSHMKMNDKKRAMLYFDLAANYRCANKEDEETKVEAEKLLKELIGKK